MELDELTTLTVDDQKEELENLSTEKLKSLREEESRRTALDSIDRELSSRQDGHDQSKEMEDEKDNEVEESNQEGSDTDVEPAVPQHIIDEQRELRHKVDYLLEKGKTVSKKGFEEYNEDDNQ